MLPANAAANTAASPARTTRRNVCCTDQFRVIINAPTARREVTPHGGVLLTLRQVEIAPPPVTNKYRWAVKVVKAYLPQVVAPSCQPSKGAKAPCLPTLRLSEREDAR